MKPAFMTAFGERISRPSVVKTQESPKAKTITSASAATTRGRLVGPEAEDQAEDDDHGAGDEVADAVAEQRADQRRRGPIGRERKRSTTPRVMSVFRATPE